MHRRYTQIFPEQLNLVGVPLFGCCRVCRHSAKGVAVVWLQLEEDHGQSEHDHTTSPEKKMGISHENGNMFQLFCFFAPKLDKKLAISSSTGRILSRNLTKQAPGRLSIVDGIDRERSPYSPTSTIFSETLFISQQPWNHHICHTISAASEWIDRIHEYELNSPNIPSKLNMRRRCHAIHSIAVFHHKIHDGTNLSRIYDAYILSSAISISSYHKKYAWYYIFLQCMIAYIFRQCFDTIVGEL